MDAEPISRELRLQRINQELQTISEEQAIMFLIANRQMFERGKDTNGYFKEIIPDTGRSRDLPVKYDKPRMRVLAYIKRLERYGIGKADWDVVAKSTADPKLRTVGQGMTIPEIPADYRKFVDFNRLTPIERFHRTISTDISREIENVVSRMPFAAGDVSTDSIRAKVTRGFISEEDGHDILTGSDRGKELMRKLHVADTLVELRLPEAVLAHYDTYLFPRDTTLVGTAEQEAIVRTEDAERLAREETERLARERREGTVDVDAQTGADEQALAIAVDVPVVEPPQPEQFIELTRAEGAGDVLGTMRRPAGEFIELTRAEGADVLGTMRRVAAPAVVRRGVGEMIMEGAGAVEVRRGVGEMIMEGGGVEIGAGAGGAAAGAAGAGGDARREGGGAAAGAAGAGGDARREGGGAGAGGAGAGGDDVDDEEETILPDDDAVVPSVYVQTVSGLTGDETVKRFHKEALSIFFGSAKTPSWDPTLLVDRANRWKNMNESYKKTHALKENRSIAQKYSVDLLLSGTLENSLYTSESSPLKDIIEENEEVLQLYFCMKRNMAKGARVPTATMGVSQLMQFRDALAGRTTVPVDPNTNEPTAPPPISEPTQPAPIPEIQVQKPAPPLYEQWRTRKHSQQGLMNPAPHAMPKIQPSLQTSYKAPIVPQVSTFYGALPPSFKIKTGSSNSCEGVKI